MSNQYHKALKAWLKNKTGIEADSVSDTFEQDLGSGCDTCDFGTEYRVAISYYAGGRHHTYFYDGSIADLIREL